MSLPQQQAKNEELIQLAERRKKEAERKKKEVEEKESATLRRQQHERERREVQVQEVCSAVRFRPSDSSYQYHTHTC